MFGGSPLGGFSSALLSRKLARLRPQQRMSPLFPAHSKPPHDCDNCFGSCTPLMATRTAALLFARRRLVNIVDCGVDRPIPPEGYTGGERFSHVCLRKLYALCARGGESEVRAWKLQRRCLRGFHSCSPNCAHVVPQWKGVLLLLRLSLRPYLPFSILR